MSDTTGLDEADAPDDPLELFHRWYADAPTPAVALGTASPEGEPAVRIVLLKDADHRGFEFHTNYAGAKARDLDANPRAALTFHWSPNRQVRVVGAVERLTDDENDEYWLTRPRPSQLGAWASRQSEVIASRAELEARLAEVTMEFGGPGAVTPIVPRPSFWGGFRVVPETIEFWHHRDDRLHDRIRYRRDGGGWTKERLSP